MKTRKQKFIERLTVTKGVNFINDMAMLENPKSKITLEWVAVRHGLSRERIRQIFSIIYGYPYTEIVKARAALAMEWAEIKSRMVKVENRKIDNRLLRYKKGTRHYDALQSEKVFLNECIDRGFQVFEHPGKSHCDFIVNGYMTDVKRCANKVFMVGGKTGLYRFGTRESQFRVTDFFAVHVIPEDSFYIIPKSAIKKPSRFIQGNNTCFYFSSGSFHHNAKNRYREYRNAWHLLNGNGAGHTAVNSPKTSSEFQGEVDTSNACAAAHCTRMETMLETNRTGS